MVRLALLDETGEPVSPLIETLLINFGVLTLLMIGLWLASVVRKDASIVDPFWGCGFVVVAWLSLAINASHGVRMILVAVLVTVWGIRLSIHLFLRNLGHGEDARYEAMRKKHGASFWWISLFTVFLLQGLILWFVAMPIQVVAANISDSTLGWLDWLGIAIWTTGFFFEAGSDWQLARFKAVESNRGKVLDRGLWRYTRHPNYFGDFCIWWGIFLLCINGGAWWTVGSPLLMSLLLMKVSGVSLLEKTIEDRRPEYAEYKRRTNAFFPGFPQ